MDVRSNGKLLAVYFLLAVACSEKSDSSIKTQSDDDAAKLAWAALEIEFYGKLLAANPPAFTPPDPEELQLGSVTFSSLAGRITSGLGERFGIWHKGIDISYDTIAARAFVTAALPGEVIRSGWDDNFGLYIKIKHAEGGLQTRYGHNRNLYVRETDKIAPEQLSEPIAEVGSTGNSSGPHLHFELRQKVEFALLKPYIPQDPDYNFTCKEKEDDDFCWIALNPLIYMDASSIFVIKTSE